MTVGSLALREWRKEKGMTQPEAAVAFGLPAERFMYISRWERGEGPGPARSIAVAIAKVTDGAVSIESWDEPALADGEAA